MTAGEGVMILLGTALVIAFGAWLGAHVLVQAIP